jgi:hypothetical protein
MLLAPNQRVVRLRTGTDVRNGFCGDADFQLLLASMGRDGDGGRSSVWMSLMDRLARTHGTPVCSARVVAGGP